MSSTYDFNVTLYRDSLSTPWGLRLEGGKDYGTPLTIQRVFTGSPSSGDLQRGDIITSINHRDTNTLLHNEANELIRNSGGSIQLGIRRGQAYSAGNVGGSAISSPFASYKPAYLLQTAPAPRSPAVNYNPYASTGHLYSAEDPLVSYVRSRPIEKSRDPKPILSQTGSPIMPGETPSMSSSRTSVKRYRPASTMPFLFSSSSQNYSSSPSYNKPSSNVFSFGGNNNMNATPMPFNEKRMVGQLQQSLSRAVHHTPHAAPVAYPVQASFNNASQGSYHQIKLVQPHHQQQQQHFNQAAPSDHHKPAWADSLRRQGANQSFDSPSSPKKVYSHHEVSDSGPKSPFPKVVNLQYNSPIGLYSKANVKEEFYKKVGAQSSDFQYPSSEF